MTELEKLCCTDSKVEAVKKINAIIENGGGGLEIGDIGIAPLGIDETKGKRRYLNGQVIIQDQYVQFTNKVKSAVALYPSLACTESEWQTTATMTVGGQVGKFVVDDEAGTIRLPKIIMPIQGLTDLSKLGEIVKAGLPNVTGSVVLNGGGARNPHIGLASPTGVFTSSTATGSDKYNAASAGNNATTQVNLKFNASNSNSIYGKSTTVQQEQIQYPYFIQVATGAETEDNIINEIELNNPFSLLDYKYSEYELNNISWLRSNGQYNSKAVYPAVYDLLLKIYNGTETKAGVSVKLSTEEYTDYDFVLNTADETFRLPITTINRVLVDKKEATDSDPTWYNLYSDGYFEHGGTIATSGSVSAKATKNFNINFSKIFVSEPEINAIPITSSTAPYTCDLISYSNSEAVVGCKNTNTDNKDDQLSGLKWQAIGYVEIPTENNNLYFYVGETVQNANLINAGRIEEKVASLIPDNSSLISGYAMPSSRYINLTLGASGTTYTAPANGYYLLSKYATAQAHNIAMKKLGEIWVLVWAPVAQVNLFCWVPVTKGETISITYSATGTTNYFKFYYAEGEV